MPIEKDSAPNTYSHHWACPKCKQGESLLMGLNTPPTHNHNHNQERAYRLSD
jgi:hypothetical protein